MKKTIIIVIVIILALIAALIKPYNNMVKKDEGCSNAWANVENAYQRRADLIPNLVKTVLGADNYEKGTLERNIGSGYQRPRQSHVRTSERRQSGRELHRPIPESTG